MSVHEFHTNPDLYELYETAQSSGEIDRVLENIKRHKSRGQYDRDKALHSVMRYVVEPSAIAINQDGKKWWERFPAPVRAKVADMILKSWEREVSVS